MQRFKFEELNIAPILPNALTYANMALGVVAIYISMSATSHSLKIASLLILIAGITDKLDGFVARKLGAASDLGRELDSLCDLISFGVAPVLIWWNFAPAALNSVGMAVLLASLLYVGAGAFRLARFNISRDHRYLTGLPITMAGMVLAFKYLVDVNYRLHLLGFSHISLENLVFMVGLSVLMVSTFKIKKPL